MKATPMTCERVGWVLWRIRSGLGRGRGLAGWRTARPSSNLLRVTKCIMWEGGTSWMSLGSRLSELQIVGQALRSKSPHPHCILTGGVTPPSPLALQLALSIRTKRQIREGQKTEICPTATHVLPRQ